MAKQTRVKKHQVNLTLETLGQLASGQAEAVVNAALRNALRDTEDRGDDKKARKVTITVEMKKIGKDSIGISVGCKPTLPNYQTDSTVADLFINERGNPEAAFSPVAPSNPDQGELSGMDGEIG